jgi:2,3-bisphosphoglycerate-independent phosphoglycerate mutase
MDRALEQDGALHLMGLVSDGGVHSQLTHLLALLDLAKRKGVAKVYVHAILDGRDTPPDGGQEYVARLQWHIEKIGIGAIASICGRFYAMDRDNRWERTELAYQLYAQGKGRSATDPVAAVWAAYARGETDEFVKPIFLADDLGRPLACMQDGDAVIFFNFRADRARQITRAFTQMQFDGFPRPDRIALSDYVCMTLYEEDFNLPVAFPPEHLENILGQVVSGHGLRQLRIAETEKYAHVTFFFNGGREKPFEGEDRILVPSPQVATYDLKPEMSAEEVTDHLVEAIESGRYDVIICNYANSDMVGHTGKFEAAKLAIETLDHCLGRVLKALHSVGGEMLVTADHGNAEQMEDLINHQPHTAHTTNPVPLVYIGRDNAQLLEGGALCDISPTLLNLMGLSQPDEMKGRSLIEFDEA